MKGRSVPALRESQDLPEAERVRGSALAERLGLAALGRAFARRLGKHNITVNIINPGPVETNMMANWAPEIKSKLLEGIPLGRLGQPEDIAAPALFLSSDLACWITGETLEVNGGLYFG